MTFPISDDIAKRLTDSVYGPGASENRTRVEIVVMSLTAVASELLRAWTPNPVQCPSRSCFGVACELLDTHAGFHSGHLGSTPAAWDNGKSPIPLPASIDTEATS